MAENKTRPTEESVETFLAAIEDDKRRADCLQIAKIMSEVVGELPKMWGNMVGFGSYHYVYESGREGDAFLAGFAPRSRNISLYIMAGFSDYDDLMARLGKYKAGKSCLYINKLADIDQDVLTDLIRRSVAYMRKKYPA